MTLKTRLRLIALAVRLAFRPGLIIGTLPNNLVDGTVADAVPVMANYNYIINQVNANAAPLSGTPQLTVTNTFTLPQVAAAAVSSAQLATLAQVLAANAPTLSFAVAASALTATLNDYGGNALSATNVAAIVQRNATAASSALALDIINTVPTLTIPSGATLGHKSGQTNYLFWYLQDSGGTEQLAVSSTYFGTQFIGSSTTITSGATSASIIYAAAGLAGVAMRLIAITTDVQAAAGTWASTPNLVISNAQLLDTTVQAIAPEVTGFVRNLSCSQTVAGASLTFTATNIVTTTPTGINFNNPNFNETFNSATTGLGGMDTGALPSSGSVAIYAATEANGTQGIFGCSTTTSITPQYSGNNLPASVVATALISIWNTNATPALVPGWQTDRDIFIGQTTVGTGVTTGSFSIAAGVPPGAKKWSGFLSSSAIQNVNMQSNSSNIGIQGIYVAAVSGFGFFVDIAIISSQSAYIAAASGCTVFATKYSI